jgi:metal-responsive CopG/Arc/MetJ family transcriptional regulator
MAEEKKQVNVDFTKYPELLEALDQMVIDDESDRSKFIRKLVRQEQKRREQASPINQKKRSLTAEPVVA